MRVLIVDSGVIPVTLYGGTERVIWGLGKELSKLGHTVTFLVKKGSHCDFASVIHIDEDKNIVDQIPNEYDIVHFNFRPEGLENFAIPYIITMHGNSNDYTELDINTVFVSENQANRYGAKSYVHNGIDWDEYAKPNLNNKRSYFHFLGKAAWRIKNVKGAINLIKSTPKEHLKVLGGVRFNFEMGIRLTFSPKVTFAGMVGGEEKYRLLNNSKGLIFPVRWHEPFGLAIIESLYYGCPVFGTPYGALSELVSQDVGFLSHKQSELREAILNADKYSRQACHEYAVEHFNSKKMTLSYLEKYEKVLSGNTLNSKAPKLKELQKEKFLPWE